MNVIPMKGWVLVSREENPETGVKRRTGPLYICWHELFSSKKEALAFTQKNNWPPGYRAVRAKLSAAS